MSNIENTLADQNTLNVQSSLSKKPRIPVAEAISRAENWRNLVVKIPTDSTSGLKTDNGFDVPKQRIFRAININIDDVKALMEDHPHAKSIRLYLSLEDPAFPYQITGMLVPVNANNRDMLTKKSASDDSTDPEDVLHSMNASTIYDFTQPCPSLCDTLSPLFNSANSIVSYI